MLMHCCSRSFDCALLVSLVVASIPFSSAGSRVASSREGIVVGISIGFVAAFVGWSIASGAASNLNFDLGRIYEFRQETGEALDGGIAGYLNLWAQKVFNPLLLAIGLRRRSWMLIAGALAAQVYFFAVTQHRIHLFMPVLVFMIYLLYARNLTLRRLYFLAGAGLAAFLVVALALNLDTAASLIVRRALYVPASVTFGWFEYFAFNPKVYWTDRFVFGRTPTDYTGLSLPAVLGDYRSPNTPFAFNAGLVGAGFGQAGLWGVALYAGILGLLLRFANGLVRRGVPVYMAAAVLIGPIRTAWADSDVLTAVLSHGLLVERLFCGCMDRLNTLLSRLPRTVVAFSKTDVSSG